MMMRRCPRHTWQGYSNITTQNKTSKHKYNQRGMYERARLFMGAQAGGQVGGNGFGIQSMGILFAALSPLATLPPGLS